MRLAALLLLALAAGTPIPPGRPAHWFSCTADLAGGDRLPFTFCNSSAPLDDRIADLLSRLTYAQKAQVLVSNGQSFSALGLPTMGSAEDTHGVGGGCGKPAWPNSTGCPTTFPAGPGLGATFDRDLWGKIGDRIGREARGLNNQQIGPLYFLDPDINLLRDPRWGRAQEVPGECPYLTGEYGAAIIKATQEGLDNGGGGEDPRYLQAASTMKHFQLYDLEGYLPNSDAGLPGPGQPSSSSCDDNRSQPHCNRMTFDSRPPARDLAGYYLAAFKTTTQRGRPAAIMCAYNALYGIPACASPLHNEVVREQWGWDGFVISDCGAIDRMQDADAHNYTHTPAATAAAALNQGGCDVNCGDTNPTFYAKHLFKAMQSGAVAAADIDRAAKRYFRTMIRLGMLDPMDGQPNVMDRSAADVDNLDARRLALSAAQKSIVLLKNTGGFLPLVTATATALLLDNVNATRKKTMKVKMKNVAFLGPLANATQVLLSAPQYHGTNTLVDTHSPLQVARRRFASEWNVSYSQGVNICDVQPAGYPNVPCQYPLLPPLPPQDKSGIAGAVEAARDADCAVLFLGGDQTTEAESFDRRSLGLVGQQEALLSAVAEVQDNVVVVLINGGPIDISSAKAMPQVKAILEAFQPGELGGDAIVDMLSGEDGDGVQVGPSGLMPYTTYFQNYTSRRDVRDVDLRSNGGTTYWWMTDPVVYPFASGMTYSTFSFQWGEPPARTLTIPASLPAAGGPLAGSAYPPVSCAANYTVVVTNTGQRLSDVVVPAFLVATEGSPQDTPLRKLFGFERLRDMQPGEKRSVFFTATSDALSVVGMDGAAVLEPSRFRIEIGAIDSPATHEIRLVGAKVIVEPNEWVKQTVAGWPGLS